MPGTAYETSAGGPFMRDINSQSGDDQELYWYMNSGHVRTEPWRFGLMGPYAMRFTYAASPLPAAPAIGSPSQNRRAALGRRGHELLRQPLRDRVRAACGAGARLGQG